MSIMRKQKTLTDYVLAMPSRSQNKMALQFKKNKKWHHFNWNQYYEHIEKLGSALISLGVQPGDRIAIMANTSMYWAVTDMAILSIQGITVPIYPNNTPEETEYILNDSEAKIIFVENSNFLKLWSSLKKKCHSVKAIYIFETKKEEVEYKNFEDLLHMGEVYHRDHPTQFSELCSSVKLENTATIVYTSGTTGLPKGVVLTHEQIMSELTDMFLTVGVGPEDMTLSFLPYAHIFGRIEHWGAVFCGFTLSFAESIEKIKANLAEIKPTIMLAVPRIFEKIYASIWTQMEANHAKLKLFKWALGVGKKVGQYKMRREQVPLLLFAEYQLAHKLVLGKIYEAVGGRLRFAVSGGAPLSPDIAEFFHSVGILILEGYGLTETTAAIAVNTPYDYVLGTVGKPHGNTQIKIADDGEILVKSPKVMKEYYKKPKETSEVLHSGWFATGDIGEFLASGHLKITDRKKDLIKTSGGKYVAPQKLENLLKMHPAIGNVLIHGDQKKYIVALISLDKSYIEKYAADNRIAFTNLEDLSKNPEIHNLVHKAMTQANAELASFESIKKFAILPDEFTVENGSLTPSLKVKRKILDKRYHDVIESLY